MWAQTDVTSTYLSNADFEGEYTSLYTINTNRYIFQPNGWTVDYKNESTWNMTVVASTDNMASNFTGVYAVPADNHKYMIRLRDNKTSEYIDLSQTITVKEAGVYTFSADLIREDGSKVNVVLYAGANTVSNSTNGTWENRSLSVTLAANEEIKVGIKFTNVGAGGHKAGADNIKITYTDPALAAAQAVLGGYIKKATALNGVLKNSTLGTAITTAEGVLASATTSSACNDASDNLSSAITTALSGATPVSLTNANFDTDVNIAADGTSSATYIEPATDAKPYIYAVTGWTQDFAFSNTAAQGTTAAYGANITDDKGNNGTNPPATDIFTNTTGGVLHLSSGWSDRARYKQVIENLPTGRYVFYYEANNQNSAANTINSNYFGVSGTAGDFYGTTNSFVFGENKKYDYNEWTACAFEFDVAKTANITFNVGVTGTTGGSATGAKLWIDNVLVYRIADIIVTDEEANAIIANAEALNDVKFNATDKSDLATKLAAFKAAKNIDNYNALNTAIIQANTSKDVYATLNTAITNAEAWTATSAAAGLRAKYNNGEYANDVTANDIYAEYQAAEIAALVADDSAVDWTSVILNASFETGDKTGWDAESRNDTGVKDQSNGTYSITSGDPVDGLKLFNSWGGTAENNVYQTIKNLPAGTYTLTALLAGLKDETLVLAANETTGTVVVDGDKTVGYTAYVKFTLADATDVEIKASNTKSQDGSDASFIKADNFRLYKGDVMTSDYTALNTALTSARAKTLGFDEDEYAPYNNVTAIAALSAAEAVNQERERAQPVLDAIVSALTSATWTANVTEVNAFYDGNFTIQAEKTTGPTALLGWSNPEGIRQLIKNTTTYPGLTSSTGSAAVFVWGNTTFSYGDTEGYTMPLGAHTIYELTFKTCGWSDGDLGYVNVDIKNASSEGLSTVSTATATKRITTENPWTESKYFFETGEAGNYKFGMWTSKHTTFTDLELKKAIAETVTVSEDATEAPTHNYANVTLNRTLKANIWNTFSVPFSAAIPTGWNVKEFDSVDENVISFKTAECIVAGKPYLVQVGSEDVVNPVFESVIIPVSIDITTNGSGDYKFKAQLYNTDLPTNGTIAYLATDGSIKKLTSGGLKGLRAYFIIPAGSPTPARINFIDDETTGISRIENSELRIENSVYNLQGQRVNKAQKGLYIKNGKKVVKK